MNCNGEPITAKGDVNLKLPDDRPLYTPSTNGIVVKLGSGVMALIEKINTADAASRGTLIIENEATLYVRECRAQEIFIHGTGVRKAIRANGQRGVKSPLRAVTTVGPSSDL